MNKQAIWIIIGLMSLALIGLAGMQVKWIVDSLKANEEQFTNKVFAALNGVAEKMAYQENIEALSYVDNGFAQSFMESDLKRKLESGEITLPLDADASNTHLSKLQLWQISMYSNDCNCSNCRAERARMLSQLVSYTRGLNLAPVASRVKLEDLASYLKQELTDKGIKTAYQYGVFDNRKQTFVISDGHYVVEVDNPTAAEITGYKNLHNSEYQVNLFQQDKESPGRLMVFFPKKQSFIWSSVIKTLLASVLFTGIVLFCFWYTISVIFQQKKISEMKNDFINNMTHEFKTPIATISLAADSIANPMVVSYPDKIKRFIDIIRQENKRMNNQVEKVLQMAQLEREEYSLKLSDVNLHDVISRAVEYIELQVERKEGTVSTALEAENCIVQGDATHLSNIINNLLDNANKYSPEKPEITVLSRNVPNGVEVTVQDKGIGMTKEARKHIFEKFYRVHTGNLHDVKGFGLGLSYVKAMITAHKGTVEVKSEPGKGSSFILFFPFKVES
jgi:two-component system phosphate regulon sensor histidine kinase PhoR